MEMIERKNNYKIQRMETWKVIGGWFENVIN